ncbi:multiple ankyrin repeats single KH domain [Colletotrichum tofieldiae]|nr:multiple ankyrin repeats single KH domain [Colletotrichum tofieldiae]GKT73159.1 multiple ankyrin repeats single KH domain [Colletotrichum tofieldiae]
MATERPMDTSNDGTQTEKPHALQADIAFRRIPDAFDRLSKGADPNERGEFYGDPLCAAAFRCADRPDVLAALLKHGASPNSPGGERHGPPLNAAAAAGNIEGVRMLLGAGADVNSFGGRYATALQAAVVNLRDDARELVGLLLDHCADPTVKGGDYGTPLAASFLFCSGASNVRALLLGKTLEMQPTKDVMEPAMRRAAAAGDLAAVKRLHAAGAEPHVLPEAAESGNTELLRFLLEQGGEVNRIGGLFGTALATAAFAYPEDTAEATVNVQLLLHHGANANTVAGREGSPLQAAAARGNLIIVKLLLSRGADVHIGGGERGLPLHAGVWSCSRELVEALLQAGADVNAEAGESGTALQVACEQGCREVAELLIERGADVNALSGFVGSPLGAAARCEYVDIARVLLDHGADPELRFGLGTTPLEEAERMANEEMAKLIRERIEAKAK